MMLAQEVWRAWSRRLCTIVVVAHPAPDLELFLVQGAPSIPIDILLLANILTAASNYCLGMCVMLAQEVWRAWSRRLGAIGVVTYPAPDLEFFEVRSLILTPWWGNLKILPCIFLFLLLPLMFVGGHVL
jgi:hypothetical protein